MTYTIQISKLLMWSLILLFACNQKETSQTTNQREDLTIPTVEVVNPQTRSFQAQVMITGTAMPNQTVQLHAMESGQVVRLGKDIGDRVKKGELIATLENPELAEQELRLQAQFNAKSATYNRLQSTYEKTPALTNLQLVEESEAAYHAAKAELDALKHRIAFLQVKAPFDGVVTKRMVDLGALVQNGLQQNQPQALVEIKEIDPIRLTIPVPESDAVSLRKEMVAEIQFPELGTEKISAPISRLANALDAKSKTMQVEIDLSNSDYKILPGMYARVLINLQSRENILSLPLLTKISHNNEDYIWIVEEGKARRINIRSGLSDKEFFEVFHEHIDEHTQVILKGKSLVREGQIVSPKIKTDL